jgi:Transposase, Mutator family
VRPDGTKEALGLWIEQTEGAKCWLRVRNALHTRGVHDAPRESYPFTKAPPAPSSQNSDLLLALDCFNVHVDAA